MHTIFMRTKHRADKVRYKNVRNQTNKLIANTQKAYQRVKIDRLLKEKNKKFFKSVKRLCKPNRKNNDCQLDAEQKNDYFASIGKDMSEKLESVSFSTNMPELTNSMFVFPE